jgi:hypothetical protein
VSEGRRRSTSGPLDSSSLTSGQGLTPKNQTGLTMAQIPSDLQQYKFAVPLFVSSYHLCSFMQLVRGRPTMGSQVHHLLDIRRSSWRRHLSPVLLQIPEAGKSIDRCIWGHRVMGYQTICPRRRTSAVQTRIIMEILDGDHACEGHCFLDFSWVRRQRRSKWARFFSQIACTLM